MTPNLNLVSKVQFAKRIAAMHRVWKIVLSYSPRRECSLKKSREWRPANKPGSTFPSPLMIPPESTSVLGHADSISFYEKEEGM